jgi:predicted nucleic-acid-binding Zn-ribbon protein
MKTCILCRKKIRKRGGAEEQIVKTKQGNYMHVTCVKIANEMLKQKLAQAKEAYNKESKSTEQQDNTSKGA